MNSSESIAWRFNQGQVSNAQAPFPSLFEGSMASNNPSTGPTPQGIFSFSSSAGNCNQLTDESQNPTSNVLNYNKTDYNAPGQFTPSFHPLSSFENAPAFSNSLDNATQNLISFNDSASAVGTGEMSMVSVPGIGSKIPQKRTLMNSHSRGSGINFGGRSKERKSPLRPRLEDKGIRKKKVASGRSRLAKALDHLESIEELLEPHNHLLAIVTHLEESIIKHMTCKTRSKTGLGSWDVDSAYQSMSRSSAAEETDSIAASFDLTLDSHSCSSKAPGDESQSDQIDMATEMETPRATQPKIIVYHCVFQEPGKTCNYWTRRKGDWIRHGESEDHFPQKRYMCISCIPPSDDDDNGNPICVFCYAPIYTLGDHKQHYLQCQQAQKGKHIFAGAREEHFKGHLRKQHGLTGIGREQSSWTFDVQSDWPSECGFCGERFSLFQKRTEHIATHFQEGADISSWRLPFGKAKARHDHRPGVFYQKWNNDDDDDDGDNGFGGGGKSLDPHLFLGSSGSSGSGSGQTCSSTGCDLQDWPSGFFDGYIFQMESRGYDSKIKVEDYLKHQLLSDQPSDCEDDSQTSDTCSDTESELDDTLLKHSPAKETGKPVAQEDGESNVEQDSIGYCQPEFEISDAKIDYQPQMKHNPSKEKQPFHFDISSIDLNVARNKIVTTPRRERNYKLTRRKEVALDPENADLQPPDTECNPTPRAQKRAALVSLDAELTSDSGSCKRTCISRSVLKKRIKPFECMLNFSGCHSAFSTKNEWKGHVSTQHMNLHTTQLCQGCPPPSHLQRTLQGSTATFGKKSELNELSWDRVKNVIEELAEDGQAFRPFGVQELARVRPHIPAFITTDDSLKLQDKGIRNLSILRSSHSETPPQNLGRKPSQVSGLDRFPPTISSDVVMNLTEGGIRRELLLYQKIFIVISSTIGIGLFSSNRVTFFGPVGVIIAFGIFGLEAIMVMEAIAELTGYSIHQGDQGSQLIRSPQRSLDSKDTFYGRTPLSWAAEYGHQAVVQRLLATGQVDVNSKDIQDRTPLLGYFLCLEISGPGKSILCQMLIHDIESTFKTTKNEYAILYWIRERREKIRASSQNLSLLLCAVFIGDIPHNDFLSGNCRHSSCGIWTCEHSNCEYCPERRYLTIKAAFDSACQGDFRFRQDHSYQCLDEQHEPNKVHEPSHLPGNDDQGLPMRSGSSRGSR